MGKFYRRLMRIEGQVSQFVPEAINEHDELIPERVIKMVKGDEIWIEVSLEKQMLYLYEGTTITSAYRVSTGKPGSSTRKSMATRKGVYRMYKLYKTYPMSGREGDGYWWCPDVPYVMFFHGELAIHGAYWHNDFGKPISHGCVNMMPNDAGDLYHWCKVGTVVWVH